jgi:hypothetical protein
VFPDLDDYSAVRIPQFARIFRANSSYRASLLLPRPPKFGLFPVRMSTKPSSRTTSISRQMSYLRTRGRLLRQTVPSTR